MQDRATAIELLDGIGRFLRTQSERQQDRWLRFQLLVASNSLAIVKRELEMEEGFLQEEWDALDRLVQPVSKPGTFAALQAGMRERQEDLCARIRAGEFDGREREDELVRFLVTEVVNRVKISAPAEL
jgi:hypothetical protein